MKLIELIEKGGRVQSFEVGHALRLLSLKNSVWSIPSESQFEFVDNAIRKKPSPKPTGEKASKATTRKRRKASGTS